MTKTIKDILIENSDVDVFHIPRVNIVSGISNNYINQWNWNFINNDKFVNEIEIDDNSEEYKFLKRYNLIISEE